MDFIKRVVGTVIGALVGGVVGVLIGASIGASDISKFVNLGNLTNVDMKNLVKTPVNEEHPKAAAEGESPHTE